MLYLAWHLIIKTIKSDFFLYLFFRQGYLSVAVGWGAGTYALITFCQWWGCTCVTEY